MFFISFPKFLNRSLYFAFDPFGFRQVFQGDTQLLSRTWLIDPVETQENASNNPSSKREREREPWNGEFYGSFGEGMSRSWEEARRYGFFSAGGGSLTNCKYHTISR